MFFHSCDPSHYLYLNGKEKKYSLPSEERALIITEPEGLCQQWKRQECLSLAAPVSVCYHC